MIPMITKSEHEYAGKKLKPEDTFEAESEADAKLLEVLGRAARKTSEEPLQASEASDEQPRGRNSRRPRNGATS